MMSDRALTPAKPWLRAPHALSREAMLAVGGATGIALALAGAVQAMPTIGQLLDKHSIATPATPPAPVVASAAATELRDIAPAEAEAINARIPVAALPLGAARPFSLGNSSIEARAQALECLTSAVYYEAAQESDDGQRAVAQVVLNRVRHPAFPASVCGVVYQGSTRATGCQFTFTCDGSLSRAPMTEPWDHARRNAKAALDGAVYAPVGTATHYHANYVLPYWAASLVKTQVVGAHLFYRWAGGWGQPSAFAQAYSGHEANAHALRLATLAVPHILSRPLLAVAGSNAAAVAKLDRQSGVDIKAAGGRVTAHFSLAARAAVEKVKVIPYVERVAVSDNLRFALGVSDVAADQAPLGKAKPTNASAAPAKITPPTS